jgi:hypothetical protein
MASRLNCFGGLCIYPSLVILLFYVELLFLEFFLLKLLFPGSVFNSLAILLTYMEVFSVSFLADVLLFSGFLAGGFCVMFVL